MVLLKRTRRPWLVVTFKGQRNRHSEGSKKAGGRGSQRDPRGPSSSPGCNMQGSGEPRVWPLGWRSQGGPGGKAGMVPSQFGFGPDRGKRSTVWVEISFSLSFRRTGPKSRQDPKFKVTVILIGYEIIRSDKIFKGRNKFGDRLSNTWSTGEKKGDITGKSGGPRKGQVEAHQREEFGNWSAFRWWFLCLYTGYLLGPGSSVLWGLSWALEDV